MLNIWGHTLQYFSSIMSQRWKIKSQWNRGAQQFAARLNTRLIDVSDYTVRFEFESGSLRTEAGCIVKSSSVGL